MSLLGHNRHFFFPLADAGWKRGLENLVEDGSLRKKRFKGLFGVLNGQEREFQTHS